MGMLDGKVALVTGAGSGFGAAAGSFVARASGAFALISRSSSSSLRPRAHLAALAAPAAAATAATSAGPASPPGRVSTRCAQSGAALNSPPTVLRKPSSPSSTRPT